MDIEEIKKLKIKVENILIGLRQNKDRIMNQVNEVVPEISSFLNEILNESEKTKKSENKFLIDMLVPQIKNWSESYVYKDIVMMADTIQYELMVTMKFYIQMKEK